MIEKPFDKFSTLAIPAKLGRIWLVRNHYQPEIFQHTAKFLRGFLVIERGSAMKAEPVINEGGSGIKSKTQCVGRGLDCGTGGSHSTSRSLGDGLSF